MNRERSAALYETAKRFFPGGVSSPVRAFKSVEGPPLFIERGAGPHIWDADGNRFLDFCGSWGPLILGHAHPAVLQALQAVAACGTSFGAPTRCENALGRLLVDHHPALEKIRFVSSGTEAVMSAIRAARGYTGRDLIVKFDGCYHGHADSLLVKAGSGLVTFGVSTSAGIPADFARQTLVLPLDDEAAFEALLEQEGSRIAAVIVEPIPANNGLLLQRPEFLQTLRRGCDAHDIVLIFDEVISGFRVGFEGATGIYGIRPDLLTFGKVIGGGLPVGAYGGRAAIMARISPDGDVYQGGTLSGNPMAMAAGCAQLYKCLEPGFYDDLDRRTAMLCDPIVEVAQANQWPLQVVREGSIFWLAFSAEGPIRAASDIQTDSMERFKRVHAALLEAGIYVGPSGYEVGFVSAAHTDEQLTAAAKSMIQVLEKEFSEHPKP